MCHFEFTKMIGLTQLSKHKHLCKVVCLVRHSSPTSRYLFRSMEPSLISIIKNKNFGNLKEPPTHFFMRRIENSQKKWGKVVENDCEYEID